MYAVSGYIVKAESRHRLDAQELCRYVGSIAVAWQPLPPRCDESYVPPRCSVLFVAQRATSRPVGGCLRRGRA